MLKLIYLCTLFILLSETLFAGNTLLVTETHKLEESTCEGSPVFKDDVFLELGPSKISKISESVVYQVKVIEGNSGNQYAAPEGCIGWSVYKNFTHVHRILKESDYAFVITPSSNLTSATCQKTALGKFSEVKVLDTTRHYYIDPTDKRKAFLKVKVFRNEDLGDEGAPEDCQGYAPLKDLSAWNPELGKLLDAKNNKTPQEEPVIVEAAEVVETAPGTELQLPNADPKRFD